VLPSIMGPGITPKYSTRLEMHAVDKQFGLFGPFNSIISTVGSWSYYKKRVLVQNRSNLLQKIILYNT
jgi:hypothetical protein